MNLQPNDIIIKNTKDGETLWLSQRLVQQVCEVSDKMFTVIRDRYKKSVQRCYHHLSFLPDSGKGWRWAKTDRGFFYCYDNIPDRNPTNYRSRFGTAEQLKAALNEVSGNIKSTLKEATKAEIKQAVRYLYNNEDYRYYQLESPVGFSQQQAKELMKSLAWCRYISREYFSAGFKSLGIQKKQDFIQLCTELLEPLQLEGLKVKSPAYLRNKIAALRQAQGDMPAESPARIKSEREFLISDKYDNDNARIVGKSEFYDEETGEIIKYDLHQVVMYNAYLNPGGTVKEAMTDLYRKYYVPGIEALDLKPIAFRTFTHHLTRLDREVTFALARHGKDYFKKEVLPYVATAGVEYSHSLFVADGSGTLNYRYYKDGKPATMKLYIILISDVASRKIVGWAPAPEGQHKEDAKMFELALKMAVENCNRMTMFELVTDNHSAFTSARSKELKNLIFNKTRTIEVGNSQANYAETQFRLFKKTLRDQTNFTSSSWSVGIEGQSNPDFLKLDDLPNYADCVIQVSEMIERYNSREMRDRTTPDIRFSNRNPNCVAMDDRVLRKLFGNHTEKMVKGLRGYMQVEKAHGYETREKYLFEIPDYGGIGAELLAKATNYIKEGTVKVVWDETAADIYTLDGKFVMTCYPAKLASPAYIETTAEQSNALGHHLKRKEEITEKAEQLPMEISSYANELPYRHAVATGGTKETWNGAHEQSTQTLRQAQGDNPEKAKRKRADRDFEW